MTRDQIAIEIESVASRLRSLRTERSGPIGAHERRIIIALEDLLVAEIRVLSARQAVLDAADILSALGGPR